MAKKYDGKIDKHTDWGGDDSTGGLPVAGSSVQAFLKETLDGKAGLFHYDATNNRYLVFADEESRDAYLDNPDDNRDLLLANFDAPFNYEAVIELLSGQFNALLDGSTGNYIEFRFDTRNKSGQSVGEDVICTFTFTRGSVRNTVTQKYRSGQTVRMNIDKYLSTGTNNVTIGIVGQQTLAATTVGVTYQVVDLRLTDSFDISKQVDVTEDVTQIEVPYSIAGYGSKRMEWELDGVALPYVSSEDEITEAETSRRKYISIEGLKKGTHSLRYRAYTVINGERFYSQTLYREFMIFERVDLDPMIAIATEFAPNESDGDVSSSGLVITGAVQYLPFSLRVAVFNPSYAAQTMMEVYVDGTLHTTLAMRNGEEQKVELTMMTGGHHVVKLKVGDTVREIEMDVADSSASVEEITQNLILALTAQGKSNGAADKEVWRFGDYRTTFSGFKWLTTSGWNDGELAMKEGASISINCAPLSEDATSQGMTLEFEFTTRNVTDNDAIICDLRNDNGTGILITASEASLCSAGGAKVSTRYKSGEQIRLAFVINRKEGVAEKCLAYLYVNGILSGATTYGSNDNFISQKEIAIASSEDAEIGLRSLRFYRVALTANQVLNNYILYRDSASEFLSIYDRNNIYTEGTTEISTDALSGQLPIMIVTGNIPALEATTDKNLQIDVDIEYINLQNPDRSFTLKDGAMRPQGTSSMSYPKKNFRIYTNRKDSTRLYDSDGKEVPDKLYAFKSGSQPVDCYCLKADYAESSGSHNTGIARLWNEAMKNAQVDGEYKLRTMAQQAAIDAGYAYDVRTTVDGEPILMFYRLTENDPLVFIGKYNFNNDKSTESVFGFRDIPGFDNSKVECWEVLNNGHPLALFTDISNWDTDWVNAYEGRYPDGNTDTKALKSLAAWLVGVSESEFTLSKWNHLDVWKVAAYYVYLMRFGAVDQVVKNAMLTTEDGEHWYFINYDNDTINGLRNDGLLIYPPTIDRQTLDETSDTGVYAYAGHDSRLWNLLEGDAEFMEMVRTVDQALYTAALSYERVVEMFDTEQSGKWCERIFNQDSQYKYIGPWTDRGENYLKMVQGSRQSHRRWWLSERFAMLDAKWVSGEYKSNAFEVKLAGAPAGLAFSIKAGVDTHYGYGVNNVPIQYGIELAKGASHTFSTEALLNVGDPLRIYAAPYLEEIEIKSFAPYLTQVAIAAVNSQRLGTKLRKLTLGDENTVNRSLTELSGINQATALRELNIRGFKGILNLDLSGNGQLESLDARDSGLTGLTLAKGCPVSSIMLPATMQALNFESLYSLTSSGLTMQENGRNLTTIRIVDCTKIDSQKLTEDWMLYKTASDGDCSLEIDGVQWTHVNADWLIRMGKFRSISLRGTIQMDEASLEQLTALKGIFGNNCFSPGSELYIQVPMGLYIIGPDSVRGLQTAEYELLVATEEAGTSSLELDGTPNGVTFENGKLKVSDINNDTVVTLVGKFVPADNGYATIKRMTVNIVALKYPATGTLTGDISLSSKGVFEYALTLGAHDDDADFRVEWEIEGEAVDNGLISLGTTSKEGANLIVETLNMQDFTIRATVKRNSNDQVLLSQSLDCEVTVSGVILTTKTNPKIMEICYAQGWAANPDYMTASEASAVTDIGEAFATCQATTFNEFEHFINVVEVSTTAFQRATSMVEMSMPFGEYAGNLTTKVPPYLKILRCPRLKTVHAKETYFFCPTSSRGRYIQELYLPELETLGGKMDFNNYSLRKLSLPKLRNLTGEIIAYFSSTTNIEMDLSPLEYLSGHLYIRNVTLKGGLNLPNLKEMGDGTYSSTDPLIYILFANVEEVNFPSLAKIGNRPVFSLTSPGEDCSINIPNLDNVRLSIDDPYGHVKNIDLSSATTLKGYIIAPGLTSLKLSSLQNLIADGAVSSETEAVFNFPLITDKSWLFSVEYIYNGVLYNNVSMQNVPALFPEGWLSEKDLVFPNLKWMGYNRDATYTQESYHLRYRHIGRGLLEGIRSFSAPNILMFGCVFEDSDELTTIDLPNVKELYRGLARNLPNLESVNLPKLATLNLKGKPQYTNLPYKFIENCPKLKYLDLPSCTTVYLNCGYIDLNNTSAMTNDIQEHWGNITHLRFSTTQSITTSGAICYNSDVEVLEGMFLKLVHTSSNPYYEHCPLSYATKLRDLRLYHPTSGYFNDTSPIPTDEPHNNYFTGVGDDVPEGVAKVIHTTSELTIPESSEFYQEMVEKRGYTIVKDL